ncbi:MAG TPA: lamin tail domain-containing protein [Verrucomicrobiae bacterium]
MNSLVVRASGGFLVMSSLVAVCSVASAQIVINEIMYHPPPAIPEDPAKEWVELYNTGTNAVNLTGWRFTKGISYTFTNVSLDVGGYLVVAANKAVFAANHPAVLNVVGDWIGKLRNSSDAIELVDALGQKVASVTYASEGDWALRREGDPYPGQTGWWKGWKWSSSADGLGKTMELMNPAMPGGSGQNWAASLVDGGTPGQPNSVATTHIAPMIWDVRHLPAIPRSADLVSITTRVVRNPGVTVSVAVFSRVDGASGFNSAPMYDDGAHGDGAAGDGVYGAWLPAQPNRTIIEFYVQASDSGGLTRTWPPPSDDLGIQGANALYQVDESTYTGDQPVYRFIVKATEWSSWTALMNNGAGGQFSDAQMNGTAVRTDGTGTKVRYRVSIRNRGAGTRSANPHNLHLGVPLDDPLQGITRLDFNTRTVHSQVGGKAIFSAANVVNSYSAAVQVRVNGNNLANATPSGGTDSYQFGSYHCFQPYDSEWAKEHLPLDSNGNVYKGVWYFDGVSLVRGATLEYLGTDPAAYRQAYSPTGPTSNTGAYSKQSNAAEDNWSDLVGMTYALSPNTPDASYIQAVSQVVNIDQWLRYFAANSLIINMETTLGTGVGDDYSMYCGFLDPRFQLLNHDLDTVLNQGDNGASWTRSIFKACDLASMNRFLKHPDIARRYYATLKEMADTVFSPAQIGPILDRTLGSWVPNSYIQSMKDAAEQRRTNVLAQIPMKITSGSAATWTNNSYRVTTPSLTLFGTANAINTHAMRVNGLPASWSAWDARWTNTVTALQPGINRVVLEALDESGNVGELASVDVWYDVLGTAVPGGSLASSTTWASAAGPYRITGNITVPAGVTLTIQPGTTVYFDNGVGLTINGQLLAQGTPTRRIRFTRTPGTTGHWAGFAFVNARQTNLVSYADMEYGDYGAPGTLNGPACIFIRNSQVAFDRMTFFNMTMQYLDIWEPQVVISHSVFGDLGGQYHVKAEHMLADGWFVVDSNLFGTDTGDNDIFHLNRVSVKGGPVAQILNNVFTGAGDDIIDDNETDSHIEGNLFMNFTTNHPARSASAAVTTGEGGSTGTANITTQHLTVLRNVFWGQDYGILNKDGSYVQVFNSVFVNNRGAIIFDEPWRTNSGTTYSGPGRACYIESSVFWNNWPENGSDQGTFAFLTNALAYRTEAQYRGATQVTVNNSLLPAQYHYLGTGNMDADPRFVFPTNNLSLKPGAPAFSVGFDGFDANTFLLTSHLVPDVHPLPFSPLIGTGFNGCDGGIYVSDDATISGAPSSPTPQVSAILAIAGLDICGYKYRLIGPGFTNDWSQEKQTLRSVSQITLAGTAATATVANHGYANGDVIQILGADSLCLYFNGLFTIRNATANTFDYTVVLGTNAPMNELPPKDIWSRKPEKIQLAGLSNGTYIVQAIRKNSIGVWQGTDKPTSATWTVDTGLRRVVINELLAFNVSAVPINDSAPDLIELQNAGGTTVDLSGMGLTDDPGQPGKFTFPSGYVLGRGDYCVLVAGSGPGTNRIGFALSKLGGGLYLFDTPANGRALVDSVSYGLQLPDLSVGRLASGQWGLTRPTLGSANVPALTGDVHSLRINEWLAASVSSPDFIELYNSDPIPVDLGGCYLTDNPVGWPSKHRIAPLTFIGGNGLQSFIADGQTNSSASYLGFKLADEWGAIGLFDTGLAMIDAVYYGPQTTDVSMGRSPNGSSAITSFPTPTPGLGNPATLPGSYTVTNVNVHLMSYNQTWRYDQTTSLDGVNWTATNYNDSGWPAGQGLLAFENNTTITPLIRTPLSDPRVAVGGMPAGHAYYFRTTFNVSSDLSAFTVTGAARIDDGAVIYVNGVELPFRIRVSGGTVTSSTLANSLVPYTGNDAVADDVFTFPGSALHVGTNWIAVSVHQQNTTSSDIVWGLALDANLWITNYLQGQVVLSEVIANNRSVTNSDGSITDWVELYNPGAFSMNLAGMTLSDDPAKSKPHTWTFPAAVTLNSNSFLVVRLDPDLPPSTNNTTVLNTGFGLSSSGDKLLLYSGATLVDAVTFGAQAQDFSIARVAPNATGPWTLSLPTPGEQNLAAPLGDSLALRINEWMADPKAGDDWFEIYNPNQQPVALGGLHLTDDLNLPAQFTIPPLSYIGAGPYGAFLDFRADGVTTNGPTHTTFKLSAGGESLGIFSADGAVRFDAVSFGPQGKGVSEGFFPDGSTNLVRFPRTPTPGSANTLPFTDVLVNEALSRPSAGSQSLELHNQTEQTIDLSGCWLSDDNFSLKKYRLPDPTILPPGSFVTIDEAQFNPLPGKGTSFALDPLNGGALYLSLADVSGNLTGYRTSVKFDGSDPDVSFGQYEASTGPEFVAMTAQTFSAPNPSPHLGPVVINEIYYHPPDVGTNDNTIDEFIELWNITGAAVPLFDPSAPTNTWHLRNAVSFDFPTNVTVPASGYALVVGFDPEFQPQTATAFRAKFSVPASVPLFGPWSGKLNNGGETIELNKPSGSINGLVPRVLVERVKFDNVAPWPTAPDGLGTGSVYSIQRRVPIGFGNDPVSWVAAATSAGAANRPAAGAAPGFAVQPLSQLVLPGASATLTALAGGAAPLYVQWRLNGLDILDATNATLSLTNVGFTDAGRYSLRVSNPWGCALSTDAWLRVQASPAITRQPESTASSGGPALFSVVARGTAPLSYQWRFNGANLAGQSGAQLLLPAPDTAQAGGYSVVVANSYGTATSAVATLTVLPGDSDGDGMPDWWELANGTNPYLDDAAADPDHDGMTNLQEYWAGTSPNDANSALRLVAIHSNGLVLSFQAVSNHTYNVQWQSAVQTPWANLVAIPSAPTTRWIYLTNSTVPDAQRYYRVQTWGP